MARTWGRPTFLRMFPRDCSESTANIATTKSESGYDSFLNRYKGMGRRWISLEFFFQRGFELHQNLRRSFCCVNHASQWVGFRFATHLVSQRWSSTRSLSTVTSNSFPTSEQAIPSLRIWNISKFSSHSLGNLYPYLVSDSMPIERSSSQISRGNTPSPI